VARQIARWATLLAPFWIALFVYGAITVRTQPPLQGDQPQYALEAFSIAQDGDRDLTDQLADVPLLQRLRGQSTFVPQAYRYRGASGSLISYHGAGLSLLLAPAAKIGGTVRALRLELVAIAAVGAQLLFGLLGKLAPDRRRWQWAVWGSVVFAMPYVGYANELFPDLPAAVAVIAVVRILAERRIRTWQAVVASACAVALPWLHIRFAIVAGALELALVLRLAGQAKGRSGADVARIAGAVGVPLLVGVVVLLAANHAWYGSTTLTAAQNVPIHRVASAQPVLVEGSASGGAAQPSTGAASERTSFHLADAVSVAPVYLGLGRSLFSARSGWLPFVPVALLGVAALIALAVRGEWWAAYGLIGALGYLLQVASTGTLPGYAIPGRFELILAPLAAAPLMVVVARVPWTRVVFVPLAVVGVLIGVISVMHVDRLFPPAGPHDRASFTASGVLLAPWPTVTRDQPPRVDPVTVEPRELGRPQHLASSEYSVVALLSRRGGTPAPASAGTVVAEVVLAIDGTVVVRQPVTVADLPADGTPRGIPMSLTVEEGQQVVATVRPMGAAPVTVGPLQFAGLNAGDTGLGQAGTQYPDLGRVLAWTAVLLALAGAVAASLRREPRDRLSVS
jgi:hypothetical protein